MANEKAVWVVAQLEEGKLLGVTFELLGKARELAEQAGTTADVVLIGEKGVTLSFPEEAVAKTKLLVIF